MLIILSTPLVLLVWIYVSLERLVRKIINRPKPKEKTDEERLFDLMENYFGCTHK